MVNCVVFPAEFGHVFGHCGCKVHVPGQRLHVVARAIPRVELVGYLQFAVLVEVHEHELRFETEAEVKTHFTSAVHLTLQDGSWAESPWLTVDVDVTDDVGKLLVPRNNTEGFRVRDGDDVGAVWALTDVTSSETSKSSAFSEHVIDMLGWDQLCVRLTLDFGERSEDKLHAMLVNELLYVLD